jgi:hypothetical protein
VTQCEFPGVADRDSAEEEGEYFRAAAHLLQELATEVRPLAQLSADMAMAIEALQQSVESLVSIVNFIPIAVDATCLIELKELARTRIARLVEDLQGIAQRAELFAPGAWVRKPPQVSALHPGRFQDSPCRARTSRYRRGHLHRTRCKGRSGRT